MSDAGLVYHFTDTARLPWIIASGELQPGRNRIGGFPDPDFLWATTDPKGDGSASVHSGEGYRFGRVLHVRVTMHDEDFERWPDITRAFPKWTRGQIRRLEKAAAG